MRKWMFLSIGISAVCLLAPDLSYGLTVSHDYTFSGITTSEANLMDGTHICSPGDPFSGSLRYTYDSETEPGVSGLFTGNRLEYYASFNDISIHYSEAATALSESVLLSIGGIRVVSSPAGNLVGNEGFVGIYFQEPIELDGAMPFELYPEQIDHLGFLFEIGTGLDLYSEVFARADSLIPAGPSPEPAAPVPEPAAMLLLCTGLFGLAGLRNKIRN